MADLTPQVPPQGQPCGSTWPLHRAFNALDEYIAQTNPPRPVLDLWAEIMAISTALHQGAADRDDPDTARLIATAATHLPSPIRWDRLAQIADIRRRDWASDLGDFWAVPVGCGRDWEVDLFKQYVATPGSAATRPPAGAASRPPGHLD